MDLSKILSMAKEAEEERDKKMTKIKEMLPNLESEEQALAYAKRLASLQPGDKVQIPNVETAEMMPGIFLNFSKNGTASFFFYDAENKGLAVQTCGLPLVVLD